MAVAGTPPQAASTGPQAQQAFKCNVVPAVLGRLKLQPKISIPASVLHQSNCIHRCLPSTPQVKLSNHSCHTTVLTSSLSHHSLNIISSQKYTHIWWLCLTTAIFVMKLQYHYLLPKPQKCMFTFRPKTHAFGDSAHAVSQTTITDHSFIIHQVLHVPSPLLITDCNCIMTTEILVIKYSSIISPRLLAALETMHLVTVIALLACRWPS